MGTEAATAVTPKKKALAPTKAHAYGGEELFYLCKHRHE